MRLSEWTWLIAGTIVAVMAGYIYLFVRKNGQANNAMAIFFFIGIVFIAIGITKLFFRRMDDKSVMDSIKTQPPEQKIVTMPMIESRPNRVEQTINQMTEQHMQQSKQASGMQNIPGQVNQSIQPTIGIDNTHKMTGHTSHTNTFAQSYQYQGPAHVSSTGAHTNHPVSQHIQHDPQHPEHHPVQNTTEHSIKCRKCGNANPGHANYCHGCGNRLK
jgi:hypothetical protein